MPTNRVRKLVVQSSDGAGHRTRQFLILGSALWIFMISVGQAATDGESPSPEPDHKRWIVRFTLAGVFPDLEGSLSSNGVAIPGAGVELNPAVSGNIDVGYFFTNNIAVGFTLGTPAYGTIRGTGTLANTGAGASSYYAPIVVMLQWHFTQFGAIKPYIGIGPEYTAFFGVRNGALRNVRIQNAWGFALEGGVDYALDNRWGINASVARVFSGTTATGTFGGAPISAKIDVNLLIVRSGVTYRF